MKRIRFERDNVLIGFECIDSNPKLEIQGKCQLSKFDILRDAVVASTLFGSIA